MKFKRSSVRYSQTPIPATPYQAAQQCWDDRLGSARVQAKNWRLVAMGAVGLALVATGAFIWQVNRTTLTPFVVEVDAIGEVRSVGPAIERYQPTNAQIAYHVAHFIQNVRSLPSDAVVVRKQWLDAYDYTTDRGAAVLNDYARENDPFARVGQDTVAVEVSSVVRISENSFQVRWLERTYTNGAVTNADRWTAIVSLLIKQPADEVRLRKNPLGIYVDGLNWSRELTTATG